MFKIRKKKCYEWQVSLNTNKKLVKAYIIIVIRIMKHVIWVLGKCGM